MSNGSPESVLLFLQKHIESVEELEVLALLLEHPESNWSIESLSRELRSSETAIRKRICGLLYHGILLAPDDKEPRYRPGCEKQFKLLSEVISFYRLRPHRVLEILYSKPVNAMMSFADAFRFKKDSS